MCSLTNSKKISREINIKEFIDSIISQSRHIIILPHEVTDHDAFAASLALKKVFDHYTSNKVSASAYIPEPSLELTDFIKNINIDVPTDEKQKDIEMVLNDLLDDFVVILVDISSKDRFNNQNNRKILEKAKKVFSIDHHRVERHDEGVLYLKKSSTSEIVLEISKELNVLDQILNDKSIVNAIIAGILIDTSFLYYANNETFKWLSILAEHGEYKKVYSVLKNIRKDLSERIARIKGAKRAEMIRVDDKIILVSHIGSHEASVASALVSLGANIAIVVSEKKYKGKKVIRVSARGSGIDLSKIFSEIAKKVGAAGGGHPSAAGIVIEADRIENKEKFIKMIIEEILKNI